MAQKTLGEWWKESTQQQKILWIGGIILVGAFIGSLGDSDADTQKSNTEKTERPYRQGSSESNNTNNNGEETSKRAYRQGYSDGQTGYGLPSYERASASDFYIARGYNYSKADYYVYKMGYEDGVYGRRKQY